MFQYNMETSGLKIHHAIRSCPDPDGVEVDGQYASDWFAKKEQPWLLASPTMQRKKAMRKKPKTARPEVVLF
jgi:hypothetical protein